MEPHALPRDASTIVVVRPGTDGLEILLTRRPDSMAFAGGMHVFPGGRVDPRDADPRLVGRSPVTPGTLAERLGGGIEPARALGHAVAALRELFEEAGVLLADGDARRAEAMRSAVLGGEIGLAEVCERLDLRLGTERLAPLSRWVTPPIMDRRFDTRFFAAELPPDAEPRFDPSEVVDHAWLTPSAALGAMATGRIGLWLPTAATLLHLEHVRSFAELRENLAPGPAAETRFEPAGDGAWRIVQSSGGGVPGLEVNGYLVGRRELVAIDPGDPSEAAFDTFAAAAAEAGGRIVAVVVTAALPEHIGGAEAMAIRLDVPILAGAQGAARLPFEVRRLADGDRLPVGDLPLEVEAVPGGIALRSPTGLVICGDVAGDPPARTVRPSITAPERAALLERLSSDGVVRVLPGHGPAIEAGRPPGSEAG
jgi:glyoxylase-like metal-dependent hydrolase (beta-lactamase superfamily II)/8-oxo-dGTP pyrophosphatase MutT (NUDIX family)